MSKRTLKGLFKSREEHTYVRVLIDCIKVNTDSTLTVIIKGGVPITVDIPT